MARYGAQVQEVTFWKGVLGIPFFACRWDSVATHAARWVQQPVMWGLLLGEVGCDFVTGRAVSGLIANTSSLTVRPARQPA